MALVAATSRDYVPLPKQAMCGRLRTSLVVQSLANERLNAEVKHLGVEMLNRAPRTTEGAIQSNPIRGRRGKEGGSESTRNSFMHDQVSLHVAEEDEGRAFGMAGMCVCNGGNARY